LLLLHSQALGVELVFVSITSAVGVPADKTTTRVELAVFHQKVASFRDALLGSLADVCLLTEDWDADLVTDQVRIARELQELSMLIPITQLSNQSLLDDFLVLRLVIENSDLVLARGDCTLHHVDRLALHVCLVRLRSTWLMHTKLLELVHDVDGLCQSLRCSLSDIHLLNVFVHLLKVLVNELVDNLRGKVYPDVENTVLLAIFESVLQVLLDVGDDDLCSRKIQRVPGAVGLPVQLSLFADGTIREQVVEKLNAQNFDLLNRLEDTYVHVMSLGDVQEDTVDEEEERLDVQKLAPREAEIKEELSQTFIVDALSL